jgi:pilus assembly protein CpaE
MDQASSEAFVTRHASGLKLLAAPPDWLVRQEQVSAEQIDMLLQLFLQHNDFVVTDLPRYVDAISTTVLERSDRVLLVVQQTLAHINGAAKLLHVLGSELGVSRDCIDVVVNRFDKNSVIELEDVRKTLRVENVHLIPNQFKLVAECIDTGKLVSEVAKGSAVAKALRDLTVKVSGGAADAARRGFFGRTLPNLLGAN